jgi:hypothetical protein
MSFGRDLISLDCGPDAVLYCAASRDLFVLNETAATVYRALTRGVEPEDICSGLAGATRADAREVERDVKRLIAQLQALRTPRAATAEGAAAARAFDTEPTGALLHCGRYRLAGFCFELHATDSTGHEAAESVLGHLHGDSGRDADTTLRLVRRGERWLLLDESNAVIDECAAARAVAPMLHASTLMLAYERARCFAALHAGAVLHGGQCVLLPAASGSGKSTLTTALVLAGFGYCTDDFVMLTAPPIGVRAVPLGIGLKEGSWRVLAHRAPSLVDLPIHVRADGKRIRYLPVRPADCHGDSVPVRALVFPQYRAGATTRCRPIRPAEALVRLAAAGYDARLSEATVRGLIDWLCGLPSYELLYDDLDRAVEQIEAVAQ